MQNEIDWSQSPHLMLGQSLIKEQKNGANTAFAKCVRMTLVTFGQIALMFKSMMFRTSRDMMFKSMMLIVAAKMDLDDLVKLLYKFDC